MPLFFNFHIILATFYTIFGTNILIQCPVSVPVCCVFYVLQKINIKQNPNGIKTDGELFWNIWDFPEEESTRNGVRGGHEGPGRAPCLVAPSGIISHWFFFPKITYIPKKSPSVFTLFGLRFVWIFCETKNGTNKNWHWALDQYVSPKNSIKSC